MSNILRSDLQSATFVFADTNIQPITLTSIKDYDLDSRIGLNSRYRFSFYDAVDFQEKLIRKDKIVSVEFIFKIVDFTKSMWDYKE